MTASSFWIWVRGAFRITVFIQDTHTLSLFNIATCDWNTLGPAFLQSWVTVAWFNSRCGTFISRCNQPPRSTQPGHPFVKWVGLPVKSAIYLFTLLYILCTPCRPICCLWHNSLLLNRTVRRICDWRGPTWRPINGNTLPTTVTVFIVIIIGVARGAVGAPAPPGWRKKFQT